MFEACTYEEAVHPLHDACTTTLVLRCCNFARAPTPPTPPAGLGALSCCCVLLRGLTAPHRAALRVRMAAAHLAVPGAGAPLALGPTEEQALRREGCNPAATEAATSQSGGCDAPEAATPRTRGCHATH